MNITQKTGVGDPIQPDYLYTTEEVARRLRVCRRTLERWRREGKGPPVTRLHENGRPLYRGTDLLRAIGK